MPELYDAAIVGGGAAGLSAALMLARSCRTALVCDDGRPRNAVAQRMHGYLTRDGTPPLDLLHIAREELQRYPGVHFRGAHISQVRRQHDRFSIADAGGTRYEARTLLLATGLYDALPEIDGLREHWGRSVFVCPYCDGWEVRGKRLAVVAKGRRAVELAQELRQWSCDLVVCLQGVDDLTAGNRRWLRATGPAVYAAPVAAFEGGGPHELRFTDGSCAVCDAAFLSAPLRQNSPLVEMIGCSVGGDGEIEIDERLRTGVAGVYAAGDAVTNVHQVALACASGVRAAIAINEDLVKQQVQDAVDGIMPARGGAA